MKVPVKSQHMKLLYNFDLLKNENISFTVFDLETTGLSNRTDRIVEIGAIRYEGNEITKKLEYLIDPQIPIPSSASNIHGIYDKDVKGQLQIESVLPEFLKMIEGSILVAHNANFDVGFIKKALGRAEMKVPSIDVLDTIRFAKKVWPGQKSYSLQNLAKFLKIDVTKAHSAQDDSRVCLDLLLKGLEIFRKGESSE